MVSRRRFFVFHVIVVIVATALSGIAVLIGRGESGEEMNEVWWEIFTSPVMYAGFWFLGLKWVGLPKASIWAALALAAAITICAQLVRGILPIPAVFIVLAIGTLMHFTTSVDE
jgi:hypothetical protein